MSLNVLIVDDSSVMRSMIKRVLNICDIPVQNIFEAGNGQEGLDIIDTNWVDLILLDINMPVMSGDIMVDQLRSNPDTKDIAIVIISSESSDATIQELKNQGVMFIHKPFQPEQLEQVITELLGDVNG